MLAKAISGAIGKLTSRASIHLFTPKSDSKPKMVKTASEVTPAILSRYRDRGLGDATAVLPETDLFFSVAKARAR